MKPDPLELAQRTAAGHLDPEAIAWLAEGFARWLAGDDLVIALGADHYTRTRSRNKALRQAADLLDLDGKPWPRACALSAAITRFESRILPQIKRNPAHPLGPVDQCLQRAWASGIRLPRKPRALLDVLCI